jgi:CHASE3 domain sensor protein
MGKRSIFLLAVVGCFVAVIGIQALLVEQWLSLHAEREEQAYIKQEILRLERLVADIDNGFRGYVLMKQSAFLGPMVAAEGRIPRVLEGLGRLTNDQPDLRGHIEVLQARLDELLDTKRRLTMELERGQEEAVLAYIRGGEGLALASTITLAFQNLDRKLQERQREWDRESARRMGWVRWGLPLTALGGVACGISIGRTTVRSGTAVRAQLARFA